MAPKLRVMAGTSPDTMAPMTSLVNTNKPHRLYSDLFDGEIVAHIKNFPNENGDVIDSEYFAREDRQGVTWSIQVQGRFLIPHSADDILFGNTFDRPLKLPWGTGAVFKFMHYIDPTLEHDLQSNTKPWALSPLVSTMPHFIHRRISNTINEESHIDDSMLPPFPSTQSISDSTPDLYATLLVHNHSPRTISTSDSSSGSSTLSSRSSSSLSSSTSMKSNMTSSSKKSDALKNAMKKVTPQKRRKASQSLSDATYFDNAGARRAYFSNKANRQAVVFGPMDVITTDFCYGFIEFSPSLSLRVPGGLSFDLMRYWDGQPVRFVCCERKEAVDGQCGDDEPWGRIFWCVSIEMYDG